MMQVLIKRFVVSIHGSGVHKGLSYVAFTLRDDSRTPVFSKPAFTSEELYGKVFDLQDKIVGRILNSMQALHGHAFVEDHPEHLVMALTEAFALVGPIKCYPSS
ncbi:hypothetical protein POM88_019305 [Heracleum sosnowskyi]|uniref:Uncharacterized protein n=1 Tax=Heracleum sosnowskyi TaxID=360622 RepID=A0AAD8N0A1_9APIA|nr:hypothetical protein POM88_019305 [Heracleum sosnowskyi]